MVVVLFCKLLSCFQINETNSVAGKVNLLRLSDVHNSQVGSASGCPTLTKLSAAFGSTDLLKDDGSRHSKTEGPK